MVFLLPNVQTVASYEDNTSSVGNAGEFRLRYSSACIYNTLSSCHFIVFVFLNLLLF